MRIVVIDPYTQTVTEGQLDEPKPKQGFDGRFRVKEALKHDPCDVIALVHPVENGSTGDRLYVNQGAPFDAPPFKFLGDTYYGKGVIVGKDIAVDAAVPLARVLTQVSFCTQVSF